MSKFKRVLSWKFLSNIAKKIWKVIEVILALYAILQILTGTIPALLRNVPELRPISIFAPGPIYSSQSDQNLKTVLDDSGIKEKLKNYKFYTLKTELSFKIKEGRYEGSGSLRFFIEKMYVSLLEEILSRNDDQIEYCINKEDKIVFIWSKNQFEQF